MTRSRPSPFLLFAFTPLLLAAAGASAPVAGAAEGAASMSFSIKSQLTVNVPEDAGEVRIWVPVPQSDAGTAIENVRTKVVVGGGAATGEDEAGAATGEQEAGADEEGEAASEEAGAAEPGLVVGRDARGNEIGYVEMKQPAAGEVVVVQTFDLTRTAPSASIDPAATRPLTGAEKEEHRADLEADTFIPVSELMRETARGIVAAETNPAFVARLLYNWMVAKTELWVKDPSRFQPSPTGNAVFALSTRSGDSADLHSLYVALLRASGIPARMVYGSLLKKPLDGIARDAGVHTWAEFWLPELGWRAADVALADMYAGPSVVSDANEEMLGLVTADGTHGDDPAKVEQYFGRLDLRRVAWSRGRDLMLEPEQNGIPVNAFDKGYVEVDGREFGGWTRTVIHALREAAASGGEAPETGGTREPRPAGEAAPGNSASDPQ